MIVWYSPIDVGGDDTWWVAIYESSVARFLFCHVRVVRIHIFRFVIRFRVFNVHNLEQG